MNKLFLLAAICFVLGCKKDIASKPKPIIVINTPVNNQHFIIGDTIRITGTVTHTVDLTEVAVHMTDLNTKNEFFHNHFLAGNKLVYNFDSKYPIPDNTKTSFKVEVEATDKGGTAVTKELIITIN